jgi:hypothetical protein
MYILHYNFTALLLLLFELPSDHDSRMRVFVAIKAKIDVLPWPGDSRAVGGLSFGAISPSELTQRFRRVS